MHPIVARQLKRAGLAAESPPTDAAAWCALLAAVSHAYEQADHDRYLLERSLSLSSEEMGELHAQLAAERDSITAVICALAEGVCAVSNSGVILFINPVARRLLKIAEDPAPEGRPLADLADARTADGATLDALLGGVSGSDAAGAEEPRLIVGGDEDRFITYGVTPLRHQRDGYVLTLRDVTGRKRMESERKALNKQLVEMSRQAGMAEVASDVLHNVGNVLNSVNVSVSVAAETVKSSKCGGVARLADLLAQNRGRLAEFLAADPAGSKVTEYLAQLGQELSRERERVLGELANLRQSTDHIREIVATQQSLAKVRGVRELESVEALAEEAIRVAEPSLSRHGVRVQREFQAAPRVLVERNQVLQVFINLIINAKQAVVGLPEDRRTIVIRISPARGGVRAEVIDKGCGIPAENLTRIFSHGFTTKKSGHGFGLHGAALAAKAMGGSLSVTSGGVGAGAVFALELPAGQQQITRAA